MDNKSLETFLTLAKEQSFSRTAEKLNITQPAVSKRIANLERELNTQLIDRIGKQTTMTHSGTILQQHAFKLLQSMDDCKTAINNTTTQVEGILKIGVSHHIGLHRLPPYLKTFSNKYPQVQLKIQFVDSEQAYQLINEGELEIALATLPPTENIHFSQKTIWNDPLVFVVSGDHPLAQMSDLKLEMLADYPAILPSTSTYTGQLVDKLFTQHNCNINYHIETNYLEIIRMMVSIGLGWAVLPRTMVNRQLHGLHVNNIQLTRQLGYLFHNNRTLSNASQAFINSF